MSDENLAVVQRFTAQVCVAGQLAVIDEVFAEGFVNHDPLPGLEAGRQGMRQTIDMLNAGLSDRKMVLDDYHCTGDIVVQNATINALHTGTMLGISASGNEVTLRGIEIWRLAGGRITERWGVIDIAGLLEQLGRPSAPAAAVS